MPVNSKEPIFILIEKESTLKIVFVICAFMKSQFSKLFLSLFDRIEWTCCVLVLRELCPYNGIDKHH